MPGLMTRPSTGTSVPSQRKGPPVLRSHSLLGSASEMQRDPLGFLTRTHQYGDLVRMRFVFSHAYLVYHPDEVKRVLQENHRNYNKDLFTYKLLRPFLGAGLLINDGESWLHQRRLMQPAFHRKRLAAYGALMTEAASATLERWQARTDADVAENRVAWVNNERPSEEIGDIPMTLAGDNLGLVMKEVPLADGSGTVPIQLMWSNAVSGPEGPIPAPHPALRCTMRARSRRKR